MSRTPSASSSNSAAANANSNNANAGSNKAATTGKQQQHQVPPSSKAQAANGNAQPAAGGSGVAAGAASNKTSSNLGSLFNNGTPAAHAPAGAAASNWAKIAAGGASRAAAAAAAAAAANTAAPSSNANSAAQTPAGTPGTMTPANTASRNNSSSGQPRQQQQQQQQGQHSRKPSAAVNAEPFSTATGSRAVPIKPAADAAINFGNLNDATATLSSSPAQRPPMVSNVESRPTQFGSIEAGAAGAKAAANANAAAPAPAPAVTPAKPAAAIPQVKLDFNSFFQGGGGDTSPEASPATGGKEASALAATPSQSQQGGSSAALLASTSQQQQQQQNPSSGASSRRASTYDNTAQAMSPRTMAAGLPHAGTPVSGMPHHLAGSARSFSPATAGAAQGMNKGQAPPNQQGQYGNFQGNMAGLPGSPSTMHNQLPPAGYGMPPQQQQQQQGTYPQGMPGTPGAAGPKMNGISGGPPSAGPRQQQTTPYLQNRAAPPNVAHHQIHHQHNRSLGPASPRQPHAAVPGPATAQTFFPGQSPYAQQWHPAMGGYPAYPYGYQYGQPAPYYQQQQQGQQPGQPGQPGRPALQPQHSSHQSIGASSPAPSMRPGLSASGSGTWTPASSNNAEPPSGTLTPATYPSGITSPTPSSASAAGLQFRPPHMPSTPSHNQSPSISQSLHASSPSFTPSHSHSPSFGAPVASPTGSNLNAGANTFAFRPAGTPALSLGKPASKALLIKKPPPREEKEKSADKEKSDKEKVEQDKSDQDKADKEKTEKEAEDKRIADEKKAAEDKAAEKARKEKEDREAQEKADLERKVREQEEEAKRVRDQKDAEEKAAKELEEAEKKRKEEEAAAISQAESDKKREEEASAAAQPAETTPSKPAEATPEETAAPSQKRPEPLDLSKKVPLSEETITAPGSALSQARIIEDLSAVTYPDSIKSPDPALNQSAKPGKFRYDRDFLLQFMAICKEKPEQLPSLEAIGMTDEGPPSAGVGMPRSVSHGGKARAGPGSVPSTPIGARGMPPAINRAVSSGFAGMGNFSAPNPAALSSAERFAASQAGGALPGRPMARTPSTTGGIPMGGPSGRGGDRRSGRGTRRGPPPPVSQLPSDVAPLETSENRWTPTVQASRLSKDQPEDSPEVVERKVKALLNKLTIENFDSISKQILDWANKSAKEQDGRILKQVIALIFEKATDEATWSAVYARLCLYLNNFLSVEVADQSIKEQNGSATAGGRLFRRYLLTRCQADYERGWAQKESATAAAKDKAADDKAKKEAIEKEAEAAGVDKEAAVKGADFSDEYYAAEKAKRRGLGLVRFIGELYKLGMLKERIMHECIKKLLANLDTPEEEDIESLCRLLATVGQQLENTTKEAHGYMDIYFVRLKAIVDNKTVSSRLQFMILDLMDSRKHGWANKTGTAGPKSIAEVHQDAARQKEEEARRASQGKGLPSRIPMDRGGSRRGQGREAGPDGWQNAPAPRPQKAGDLTTLGKIRSSSGSPSLGMLGARTGQKAPAKEETSITANAFALLAGGDEAKEADAMSPPAESSTRKPLQLQPRSKPAPEAEADKAGEEEEGEIEEDESAQDDDGEMSEATKRSISNSVAEYLSVKMVDEAKQTFEELPPKHRGELAKAFISKAVDGKTDVVNAVLKLFKYIGEASTIPPEIFRDAFVPTIVDLEDISGDAPKAFSNIANLIKAASLSKEDVEHLQQQMVSNEDDLEGIQNRLMEEYEKAFP